MRPHADGGAGRTDRPVDASKRRPWIDWIHTAADQGALVRGYTKWTTSRPRPSAAREAVLRAAWIANTAPRGPTYVNLDAGMQEMALAEPVPPIDASRFMPPVAGAPPAEAIEAAVELLRSSKHPVILAGRVSRDLAAWEARIALAERLNARVITDLKVGAAFPTQHRLHTATTVLAPEAADAIRFSRRHPQPGLGRRGRHVQTGRRREGQGRAGLRSNTICTMLEHGLSGSAAVDVFLACEPHEAVPALLAALGPGALPAVATPPQGISHAHRRTSSPSIIWRRRCANRSATVRPPDPCLAVVERARAGPSIIPSPISAPTAAAASAAAPNFGRRRAGAETLRALPVAVCGDGDFHDGRAPRCGRRRITAFRCLSWSPTIARSSTTSCTRKRVARVRNRPIENRWVGQRISEPDIDIAAIARVRKARKASVR